MASYPTRLHVQTRASGFRRCESQKVGYETREDALDAAERQMELGKVDPGCHIMPYACSKCGEWHVANKVIVPMKKGWNE